MDKARDIFSTLPTGNKYLFLLLKQTDRHGGKFSKNVPLEQFTVTNTGLCSSQEEHVNYVNTKLLQSHSKSCSVSVGSTATVKAW